MVHGCHGAHAKVSNITIFFSQQYAHAARRRWFSKRQWKPLRGETFFEERQEEALDTLSQQLQIE